MAVMLIVLAVIISIQLVGCTSAANGAINITADVPDNIKGYPLLDNRGILHKYRDNYDKIIFPRHNEKLTQFCGIHFQWEVIKSVWKREWDEDYRWHYIVSRSKK